MATIGEQVSLEPKKYDYDKMIDCAAILAPDGKIWTGHRHGHCIHTIVQATGVKSVGEGYKMGFVTMSGRFVDRNEAAMIAVHAGQVTFPFPQSNRELFSEDLY